MTKTECCTFEGQKFKDSDRSITIDWALKCLLPYYKTNEVTGMKETQGKRDAPFPCAV